jgi:hypothetical protein
MCIGKHLILYIISGNLHKVNAYCKSRVPSVYLFISEINQPISIKFVIEVQSEIW